MKIIGNQFLNFKLISKTKYFIYIIYVINAIYISIEIELFSYNLIIISYSLTFFLVFFFPNFIRFPICKPFGTCNEQVLDK